MVSELSDMAIKGYNSSSVLSSTQELVTILVKFLQDRLRAPNGASMAKENAQNINLCILQLNSHRITLSG